MELKCFKYKYKTILKLLKLFVLTLIVIAIIKSYTMINTDM